MRIKRSGPPKRTRTFYPVGKLLLAILNHDKVERFAGEDGKGRYRCGVCKAVFDKDGEELRKGDGTCARG